MLHNGLQQYTLRDFEAAGEPAFANPASRCCRTRKAELHIVYSRD